MKLFFFKKTWYRHCLLDINISGPCCSNVSIDFTWFLFRREIFVFSSWNSVFVFFFVFKLKAKKLKYSHHHHYDYWLVGWLVFFHLLLLFSVFSMYPPILTINNDWCVFFFLIISRSLLMYYYLHTQIEDCISLHTAPLQLQSHKNFHHIKCRTRVATWFVVVFFFDFKIIFNHLYRERREQNLQQWYSLHVINVVILWKRIK